MFWLLKLMCAHVCVCVFHFENMAHLTIDSRSIYMGIRIYNQSLAKGFYIDLDNVKTQCVICDISLTGPGVGKPVF